MKFVSPKILAQAVGVSESSLKRWADEGKISVSRTAGGHRRIPLAEAVRFIRHAGLPVVNPRVLGLPDLADVEGSTADSLVLAALHEGSAEDACGTIVAMYLRGRCVADICDKALATALHEMGDLWKHERAGIFIEHRATDICLQALNRLRNLLAAPDTIAPMAIGGALSGDPYLVPSLMAATVLAADGWRAVNLGPELPLDILADAAKRSHARLAWISVSVVQVANAQLEEIVRTTEHLSEHGTRLIVGGQGWTQRPSHPSVNFGASMSELSAYAKGLFRATA